LQQDGFKFKKFIKNNKLKNLNNRLIFKIKNTKNTKKSIEILSQLFIKNYIYNILEIKK
jgi:hypothetical protein